MASAPACRHEWRARTRLPGHGTGRPQEPDGPPHRGWPGGPHRRQRHQGRAIRRDVERDLDNNAPFGPVDVDALVVLHLRRAGEDGVPPVEVEHHGSQDVGAEIRITSDRGHHVGRLGGEEHPGDVDRVAPDVEEGATAGVDLVPDIPRDDLVEVREERLDGAQLATRPPPRRGGDETSTHSGCSRYMNASMSFTPDRFAASIISAASSLLVASGFSQSTCLPAAAAAIVHSGWR